MIIINIYYITYGTTILSINLLVLVLLCAEICRDPVNQNVSMTSTHDEHLATPDCCNYGRILVCWYHT